MNVEVLVVEGDAEGGRPRRERCEGVSGMSDIVSFWEMYGIMGRRERMILIRKRMRSNARTVLVASAVAEGGRPVRLMRVETVD